MVSITRIKESCSQFLFGMENLKKTFIFVKTINYQIALQY